MAIKKAQKYPNAKPKGKLAGPMAEHDKTKSTPPVKGKRGKHAMTSEEFMKGPGGDRVWKTVGDAVSKSPKPFETARTVREHLQSYPGDLPLFEAEHLGRSKVEAQKGSGRHAATSDTQFGGK